MFHVLIGHFMTGVVSVVFVLIMHVVHVVIIHSIPFLSLSSYSIVHCTLVTQWLCTYFDISKIAYTMLGWHVFVSHCTVNCLPIVL